jgi:ferredoxin
VSNIPNTAKKELFILMEKKLLTVNHVEISIEINKTILEHFLDRNLEFPHGCKSGSCGACICSLSESDCLSPSLTMEKNTLERNGYLEPHIRLACRAKLTKEPLNHLLVEPVKGF